MVFLSRHLKIQNVKEKFLMDRVQFLHEMIRAFLVRMPFQNITSFGSFKPEERRVPKPKSLLEACLRGTGGLCGHHNMFMKMTLETIGYETHLVSGCFRRTGVPGSHCMTLIKIPPTHSKDKKNPDHYLLDVGCGIPLHEPILLSDLPFKGRAGGLDFRYERIDENNIQRINVAGDAIIGPKKAEFLSPQDYVIDLTAKPYQHFMPAFTTVYENSPEIFLHHAPYLFRYLSLSDSDFEIVVIRGLDLIFVTKETRSSKTFKTFNDLRPSILEYFPMVPLEQVDAALENFTIGMPKIPIKKAEAKHT